MITKRMVTLLIATMLSREPMIRKTTSITENTILVAVAVAVPNTDEGKKPSLHT
jgi:hypothetical protein